MAKNSPVSSLQSSGRSVERPYNAGIASIGACGGSGIGGVHAMPHHMLKARCFMLLILPQVVESIENGKREIFPIFVIGGIRFAGSGGNFALLPP
jgi:hypothetical protein